MRKTIYVSALLALVAVTGLAQDLRSTAPTDAELYFITPQDGAILKGAFTVRFGLAGMGVAPAGTQVEATGHHHLLIDVETLPDLTQPLPATDNIRHFGKGQTETRLELPPGTHTLQLLLGNFAHVPHDPPVMSAKITVTVE